jgi:hypothetical protein
MSSPFVSFANFTATFQVSGGALTQDAKGNWRPGKAAIEVIAQMDQTDLEKSPVVERRPGIDSTAVYLEGTLISPLPLPSSITPNTPCSAVWNGINGEFFLEFQARDSILADLGIDFLDEIKGWWQPSSFTVSGGAEPPPDPVSNSGSQREILAIATPGQSVFTLSGTPTQPHLTGLYLNGVKAMYGIDYSINGSLVNWLGVELVSADFLEIFFF